MPDIKISIALALLYSPLSFSNENVQIDKPICFAEQKRESRTYLEEDQRNITNEVPYIFEGNGWEASKDLIRISPHGMVESLCNQDLAASLKVPRYHLQGSFSYEIDDPYFKIFHHEIGTQEGINIDIYNARHHNNKERWDHERFEACSISTVIGFQNNKQYERKRLSYDTGVVFPGFLETWQLYATSSAGHILESTWAIFIDLLPDGSSNFEKAILIELPGDREGVADDGLKIDFVGENGTDLFIGLGRDFELNQKKTSGDRAYLHFTITALDLTTVFGMYQMLEDMGSCHQAADLWSKPLYSFDFNRSIPAIDDALEFVGISQCFSNSQSQQKWKHHHFGEWSLNANQRMGSNLVLPKEFANLQWFLGPFAIYIQKSGQTMFNGSGIKLHSSYHGAVTSIPGLQEGDRVKIQSIHYPELPESEIELTCHADFESAVNAQ